jgi:DNA-directed RNA polymerase specialized sigma24 family protein
MPEAQVAQVLNCAVGTVKSTLSQALAKLRADARLTELWDREAR